MIIKTTPTTEELTPWQKENLRYQKEKAINLYGHPLSFPGFTPDEEQSEDQTEEKHEEGAETEDSEQAPRSFADRLPNLKKYRNRVLLRRLLLLIIGCFADPVVIYSVLRPPLSKLADVKVVGNDQVSAQSIIEHSELTTGEEIWPQYFDSEQTEQAIKKALPRVKNVQVTITSLNQFKIPGIGVPRGGIASKR